MTVVTMMKTKVMVGVVIVDKGVVLVGKEMNGGTSEERVKSRQIFRSIQHELAFEASQCETELDFFQLFFTNELLEDIVAETNRYAKDTIDKMCAVIEEPVARAENSHFTTVKPAHLILLSALTNASIATTQLKISGTVFDFPSLLTTIV